MTQPTTRSPARPAVCPAVCPAVRSGGTSADRRGAATDLRVTLCRAPGRFAGLAARWEDLHRRCRAAATPFQTHSWLHSWWLSYGIPGRLRLVLARPVLAPALRLHTAQRTARSLLAGAARSRVPALDVRRSRLSRWYTTLAGTR